MNLIYDRTAEDVERALALAKKAEAGTLTDAEKAEWLAGMKGCYNATDMNRVEAAVKSIAAALNAAGYAVEVGETKHTTVPEGYTILEYIESTGTQYIDTGISAPAGCRLKCKIAFTELTSTLSVIFGSHDAASPYYRNFLAANTSLWEIGAYGTADFGLPSIDTIFDIDVNTKSGEIGCTINGTAYDIDQSIAPSSTRSSLSVYLFALHYADGLFASKLKSYGWQMYVDDILVRDYTPCKTPDGEVGLYDTITQSFYGNAGTGAFTAGTEIETESHDWQTTDIIRLSQWRQYLANVQALRDAYYTLAETGQLPDAEDRLDYIGANTIEKILADIDLLLDGMKSIYRRAGTFSAGGSYTRQIIRSI